MRIRKDNNVKDKLCNNCLSLYEQSESYLSQYCLHCKELVLKSLLNKKEKRDDD
jgi:hypothetical protein